MEGVANLLGRLDGTALSLPDRQILIRSFVRREAQLSSFIENTYASYEDVADAQKPSAGDIEPAEVKETVNAERAINAGVSAVFDAGEPISLSLIRRMHGVLLDGVRGHDTRGRFREVQVYIGEQGRGPDHARFVPPPPLMVRDLMEQLQTYITSQNTLPALIQIALTHYQFEAIHPFEDGNGRLGRILILLGLCQHKLLAVPLINVSLHFEQHRRDYYDALLAVSTRGDWIGWTTFFIEGLRVAIETSLQKLHELINLRQNYHDIVAGTRGSAMLLKLVDNLFLTPAITVSDATEIMGVSYEAARLNVQKLVKAGVLRQRESGYRAKYVADEILKAVNVEPTRR